MATNWDKDKPAGTQKIRLSDEEIRANQAALEDAIGRNHEFPGNENTTAGEHTVVELQDQSGDPATPAGVVALYNNADAPYFRKASSGTIVPLQFAPSGTKMLFIQNTAPTGWTFVAENNDTVIINQSTVGNGGTTGGSWTISGISSASHALTESEMPAHTHGYLRQQSTAVGSGSAGGAQTSPSAATSDSTGGSAAHSHTLTLGSTWRPLWVGSISCTKD